MGHFHSTKTLADAPPEMNAEEAAAWLRGYEQCADEAADFYALQDAGEDA